ncbi:cytochrome P450 [Streptomyces sp. NPDC057638]|uniref:cytochrome P450 n=1 Tax=Streptomyces sp. NPDC057638 TaxID=3346190 RepID=UPI00369D6506
MSVNRRGFPDGAAAAGTAATPAPAPAAETPPPPSATAAEPPRLPFPRANVLDPAPGFAALRAEGPITRVRTMAGDLAWAVTGYEVARDLLTDARLGRSHPHPERAARISGSPVSGGPLGDHAIEAEMHRRMREALSPGLGSRRVRTLTARVESRAAQLLDAMAAMTPPVDLHQVFSQPLPVHLMCELFGVPPADRDGFLVWSASFTRLDDPDAARAAQEALSSYVAGLIEEKRRRPAEDLISDLAAITGLPDAAIVSLTGQLVFAGHDTAASRIDYGAIFLMREREQRAALGADPALLTGAVEEVLRMSVPSDHGMVRYAHTDIETSAGVTIHEGEAVLLFHGVANRDPSVFTEPERFLIDRPAGVPHLGLGYGIHYCLGAPLARLELRAALGGLFGRFPELSLAVPLEDLKPREHHLTGGLTALPVTWP